MSAGALSGWRVLELADGVAARFCGKLLSDLGADVVMIEPAAGHAGRAEQPRRGDGLSIRFQYLSTGKTSVIAEATDDGRLRELVEQADVVVTDWRPERITELVTEPRSTPVVTVRPYGSTGPRAAMPAHHLTVFHASGEGSTLPSGRAWEHAPDRPPVQLGSEIGFFDAGWNAAIAVVAACYDRLRGHHAQRVDVSVQESLLSLSRTRLNRFHNDGVCVGREKNRYGITGMLTCSDGWVQVVGLRDEHWDRLLTRADAVEFREAGFGEPERRRRDTDRLGVLLAQWCARRTKSQVASIISGLGAPAGIFADADDLLASRQLAHRGFFVDLDDGAGSTVRLPGAPYRLSRSPAVSRPAPGLGSGSGFEPREAAPSAVGMGNGRLLEGVRVLDFSWAAAGPYTTLLLGLLGAEIVKVESSRRIDPARYGFLARYDDPDRSPIFNELNLNKRSLRVDLTQPEGVAIVKRLASRADVVVENFRPGVLARLGLAADDLLAANPRLVVASSSANGASGPDSMGAGLASIFAATGGLSVQTGYLDSPPAEVGDPVDYRSGAALTVAVLAALLDRARTGHGQYIDLSSREVVIAGAPDMVLAHAAGIDWAPRLGNRHRSMSPHDVYPCADGGWLAVAVDDEVQWRGLCAALGRSDWRERYSRPAERRAAEAEIAAAITAWAQALTARRAAQQLQQRGVPASAVLSFADLAYDSHLAARETFVEVTHPELGRQRVMRAPWIFSDPARDVRRPAPLLGADSDMLLAEIGAEELVPAGRRNEVLR